MSPADTSNTSETGTASKAARAFRTISEVSRELDVPQHVLRFWESKFTQISPLKRGGGRRYYRPEDIRLLERIRDLLYVDGFTIKGVQKLIRERGVKLILKGLGCHNNKRWLGVRQTAALATHSRTGAFLLEI